MQSIAGHIGSMDRYKGSSSVPDNRRSARLWPLSIGGSARLRCGWRLAREHMALMRLRDLEDLRIDIILARSILSISIVRLSRLDLGILST